MRARYELLYRLIEILNERFGSGFDVEYVGLGRYATSIKQAPFELAIIVWIGFPLPVKIDLCIALQDVQSELGITGRDYTSDLPDIYNPLYVSSPPPLHSRPNDASRTVARALEGKGFHGYINNHSLSRTVTKKLPAAEEYVHPQTEDIKDQEWFWFNRRGLVYPERLHIESPIVFDLILPGPATTSLVRMLEKYSELFPGFRDLVSVSFLWCHSLGMTEISPTCLALLFVSFLQV